MELSGIRSQGSTLAMVDINSQEDITQCSETSKKTFAPDSNATETTDITEASAKSDKFCIKKCFSYICLAFVISFVIAILLIPIVIYVTLSPQENSFLNDVDFQSCSVNTGLQETIKSDSTLIQVCGAQILDKSCGNISAVRALQLVYALGAQLMNDQCTENALPFFCTAIDSLCEDNSNLSLNKDCIQVRDNICSTEWRIIENLFNTSIPSCDSFKVGTSVIFSSAPIQTCPDSFEVFCGSLCLPSCQQITLLRDGVDTAVRVWFITLYIVNIIGGVIIIIASIIYRQKMLRYPMIFIVYSTITLQIHEFFFFLPIILGSNNLLCSDANLLMTIRDSTTFCQVQGFIVQATLIIFMGFWITHLLHMFYSIAFPFRANRFIKSHSATRRAHFIEAFVIITLGLLMGSINISTSGYWFTGFPQVCEPASLDAFFYSQLIPFAIGGSTAILTLCLLVLIVRNHSSNSSRKPLFTAAETKLFIVFLYYGVTTLSFLCSFCALLYLRDDITSRIADYITCTAGGDKLECHMLENRVYDATATLLALNWISTTLAQLISIVNLNFVLQYSDIKKIIGYLCSSSRHNS